MKQVLWLFEKITNDNAGIYVYVRFVCILFASMEVYLKQITQMIAIITNFSNKT